MAELYRVRLSGPAQRAFVMLGLDKKWGVDSTRSMSFGDGDREEALLAIKIARGRIDRLEQELIAARSTGRTVQSE